MTTFEEARRAVYERWRDNWTLIPEADWGFAGEGFKPPTDRAWALVTVRGSSPSTQTLGGVGLRRFTRQATLFVQLFVPIDTGEGPLDPLMKGVTDLFESVTFDGLRFFPAYARGTGEDDGKWQGALVEVPFDYHETK